MKAPAKPYFSNMVWICTQHKSARVSHPALGQENSHGDMARFQLLNECHGKQDGSCRGEPQRGTTCQPIAQLLTCLPVLLSTPC
jgi:hypothetical protein